MLFCILLDEMGYVCVDLNGLILERDLVIIIVNEWMIEKLVKLVFGLYVFCDVFL